jgi:hypothetical protein
VGWLEEKEVAERFLFSQSSEHGRLEDGDSFSSTHDVATGGDAANQAGNDLPGCAKVAGDLLLRLAHEPISRGSYQKEVRESLFESAGMGLVQFTH